MNRLGKHRSLWGILLSAALLLQGCGIIVINDAQSVTRAPETTEEAPETTAAPPDAPKVQKVDPSAEYEAVSDAYLRRITSAGFQYDGESFFIAAPRTEMLESDDTASLYSAAIYRRNQRLEEALNIRILPSATDEASFYDLLNASIQADDYFSDLLMIPAYQIGTFALGGVLLNMRSLPLLDLSQPYFFADSVAAATAGNSIYAAAGPASFEETSLSAVYFNRDLFEENGLEIPYRAVYNGTWTWDAFFTSCAQTDSINRYAALNGTDPFSSYSSQYAAELLPAMVYATSGRPMIRADAGSSPAVNISEEDADVLAAIARLGADPNAHRDTASGVSRFHTGHSLYLIDRLYLMSWMPNSRQNWGILPLPKMSEEQEHITLADPGTLFFAVQKNSGDVEKASVVLSALNAASCGVLSEAYVQYAMNELLRDNDSANMLSIISASRSYDFALAFEHSINSLSDATTKGLADLAGGLSVSALLSRAAAANRQLSSRFPNPS